MRRRRFAKWTASDLPDEMERMEEFINSSIAWWRELLARDELTEAEADMIDDGIVSLRDMAESLEALGDEIWAYRSPRSLR